MLSETATHSHELVASMSNLQCLQSKEEIKTKQKSFKDHDKKNIQINV